MKGLDLYLTIVKNNSHFKRKNTNLSVEKSREKKKIAVLINIEKQTN